MGSYISGVLNQIMELFYPKPSTDTQPPTENVEGYCVGSRRVNTGTWYVPNGKTPQECTYCEFCIKNGCIPAETVTKITEKLNSCNCDCPNRNTHPRMISLCCPVCRVKYMGMMSCCSCGMCKKCHGYTPNPGYTYCTGCSNYLKCCEKCGNEMKTGNEYLEGIKHELAKKIEHHTANLSRNDPISDKKISENMMSYHKESIKEYEDMYEKFRPKYENKTAEEMYNCLVAEERERIEKRNKKQAE